MRGVELLAPARTVEIGQQAIMCGADAVYIGASSHGARQAAANTVEQIRQFVKFAHGYNVRVYVTLNTLVYDDELSDVQDLVWRLYAAGVDAIIVQDMSLLRMHLPPIALHASTQCDIAGVERAKFLKDLGFSQLVLARELTLDETTAIHRSLPDVPLEAFVHGALCVSYSGNCQVGFYTHGRSSNRGECPQICRHAFDLIDDVGNVILRDKHLLSLRDLNRAADVASMIEAGISSFKIEGRLKDTCYVKNTVASYSDVLNKIISQCPSEYKRTSHGIATPGFTPDLSRGFNRGYTGYFTRNERPADERMASFDTPKSIGLEVGRVIRCKSRLIEANLSEPLHNGDGLGYFDARGKYCGFRVNLVQGERIFTNEEIRLERGTVLYRNHDKVWIDNVNYARSSRTVDVKMHLRAIPWGIAIEISDHYGNYAIVSLPLELVAAKTPQGEVRQKTLLKTGDTIFRVTQVIDHCVEWFIPLSALSDLRRRATEALSRVRAAVYKYDYRQAEQPEAVCDMAQLTYHNNVSNHLSAQVYAQHGVRQMEAAVETGRRKLHRGDTVMTTRYCLRRELGACLHLPQSAGKLPRQLYLMCGPHRFALEFDCHRCGMRLVIAE